jgi:hypothetical protein
MLLGLGETFSDPIDRLAPLTASQEQALNFQAGMKILECY